MTRGDIFWADLVPRSGSEQAGRRPVIIVSNNGFNRVATWNSIIVVPVSTSARQAGRGPTVIPLAASESGLPKSSVALCHQVTTLDRAKLVRHLGTLSSERLGELDRGLRAALALE